MKFQNPSFKFFFERTDKRTDKPKAICSPLFQSGGIITKTISHLHKLDESIFLLRGVGW